MPDLNSLPPSLSTSSTSNSRAMSSSSNNNNNNNNDAPSRGDTPSPSPRASTSLQAAAAVNAGLQHEPSRRSSNSSSVRGRQSPHSSRRRSQVLMNLQLNDPSVPAPGEMVNDPQTGSSAYGVLPQTHSPQLLSHSPQPLPRSPRMSGGIPHHSRTPSLGELHQELEAEQEAQVNRLLSMIRQQQLQLQQLQAQQGQGQSNESAIADSADRATVPLAYPLPPSATSQPRSPSYPSHPRSSFDMARQDLSRRSRTPSRGASPRVRSTSISGDSGEQMTLGGRDENAFYQAETQMLVRENQMLRHRVRDLEKQLQEVNSPAPSIAHEPSQHSHLTHSTSITEETEAQAAGAST